MKRRRRRSPFADSSTLGRWMPQAERPSIPRRLGRPWDETPRFPHSLQNDFHSHTAATKLILRSKTIDERCPHQQTISHRFCAHFVVDGARKSEKQMITHYFHVYVAFVRAKLRVFFNNKYLTSRSLSDSSACSLTTLCRRLSPIRWFPGGGRRLLGPDMRRSSEWRKSILKFWKNNTNPLPSTLQYCRRIENYPRSALE